MTPFLRTAALPAALALVLAACATTRNDASRTQLAPSTGASATATGGVPSTATADGDWARGLGLGADQTTATGAQPGAADAGSSAALVARTAPEALALVALVDQHELELARQARAKGVGGPALDYARMMEAHHGPHLEKTRQLLATLGGAPGSSPALQQLTAISQQAMRQLATLEGQAYERAYIDRMVADHQLALQMVSASMGVARQSTVRTHLAATRQTIQQHLDRARALQRQLQGRGGDAPR